MSEPGDKDAKVFISYSRRDGELANRLHFKLEELGFDSYLDTHDIAAGEDWRTRLGKLILSSDSMIFLISPDSIGSEICGWEVAEAERLGKRILPIVYREPDGSHVVPDGLKRLNYAFMRNSAEEAESMPLLAEALAVDIDWIRRHTRYGERADEWEEAGKPKSLLMQKDSVNQAEQWRDIRPSTAPTLTVSQSAYIAASRRAATNRQRAWVAGSLAVAVLAISLSIYALFQQRAATTTLATSDLRRGGPLADNPQTATEGISYLARAAEEGDSRAQTRLWTLLQQRSFWVPSNAVFRAPPDMAPVAEEVLRRFKFVDFNGKPQTANNVAVSGDGKRVFTSVSDGQRGDFGTPVMTKLWNADGTALTEWQAPPWNGDQWLYWAHGYLSETGRYLAMELQGWRDTSILIVYDLEAKQQLETNIVASGPLSQTQQIGFNDVHFVERPARNGTEAQTFLVTASAKGDAVVYRLWEKKFVEVARNTHRSPVRVASVDTDNDDKWLMSAAEDGTVVVSKVGTYASSERVPVGNIIYTDTVPTGLSRNGTSGLLVKNGDAQWSAYDLRAAVKADPSSYPALEKTDPTRTKRCVSFGAGVNSRDPGARLEYESGLVITAVGNRQVSIAHGDGQAAVSRVFAADINVVCVADDGNVVTVTTVDFRTEIWKSDFSEQIGLVLDEKQYFDAGLSPQVTNWVDISSDGQRALIRSSFYDGPGSDTSWITVWDIESGLPLADRKRSDTIGSCDFHFGSDGNVEYVGDAASLTSLQDCEIGTLRLGMSDAVRQMLPQYVEAIVNQRINAQGLPERIADRAEELAAGDKLLQSGNR